MRLTLSSYCGEEDENIGISTGLSKPEFSEALPYGDKLKKMFKIVMAFYIFIHSSQEIYNVSIYSYFVSRFKASLPTLGQATSLTATLPHNWG